MCGEVPAGMVSGKVICHHMTCQTFARPKLNSMALGDTWMNCIESLEAILCLPMCHLFTLSLLCHKCDFHVNGNILQAECSGEAQTLVKQLLEHCLQQL